MALVSETTSKTATLDGRTIQPMETVDQSNSNTQQISGILKRGRSKGGIVTTSPTRQWLKKRFRTYCFTLCNFDMGDVKALQTWIDSYCEDIFYVLMSVKFCKDRCSPYIFGLVETNHKQRLRDFGDGPLIDRMRWHPLINTTIGQATAFLKQSQEWWDRFFCFSAQKLSNRGYDVLEDGTAPEAHKKFMRAAESAVDFFKDMQMYDEVPSTSPPPLIPLPRA